MNYFIAKCTEGLLSQSFYRAIATRSCLFITTRNKSVISKLHTPLSRKKTSTRSFSNPPSTSSTEPTLTLIQDSSELPEFADDANNNPSIYYKTNIDNNNNDTKLLGRKFVMVKPAGILTVEGEFEDIPKRKTKGIMEDIAMLLNLKRSAKDLSWLSESDYPLVPCLFKGICLDSSPASHKTSLNTSARLPNATTETFKAFETLEENFLWNQKLQLPVEVLSSTRYRPIVQPLRSYEAVLELLEQYTEDRDGSLLCGEMMWKHLQNLTMYHVGSELFNPTLVFILGRTCNGNMGGIATAAIET